MTISSKELGRVGEEMAIVFLLQQGYSIVEQNYRNDLGELDVVAYDKDVLCFIEVKTRQDDEKGSPFEAITRSKQRKLFHMAQSYLKHKQIKETAARFDVIGIQLDLPEESQVKIVKNAFEMS